MRAEVGQLAAGVVVLPAEAAVTSPGRVGLQRGGAEPAVVVETGGDRLHRLRRARRAVVIIAVQRLELAEHAAAGDVHAEAKTRDAAPLGAALVDGPEPLHRIGHGPALGDRQRDRLFAVDVLAGLGRFDGDDRVPMVRRGDQHRVEIAAGEDLAKIVVRGAVLVAIGGVDRILGALPVTRIDIADGQHPHVLKRQEALEVVHPLPAQADRPHREPLAGRSAALQR